MARSGMPTWALQGLPALSLVAAAAVFLGPGKPRAAVGARVWGAPEEGALVLALRVEGLRRLFSVDDAAVLDGLRVEVLDGLGKRIGSWEGSAGEDGVAEAAIALGTGTGAGTGAGTGTDTGAGTDTRADTGADADTGTGAGAGTLEVKVMRGDAALAAGRVERMRGEARGREPGVISGATRGDCSVRVEAVRGVMAAPFEEELRIEIGGARPAGVATIGSVGGDSPLTGCRPCRLTVSAPGADVRPESVVLSADGRGSLRVKPLAHNVQLSLKAALGEGKTCEWEGYLPVVPGALWFNPQGLPTEIRIVSAAPRSRAYVSFVSDKGREGGAVVKVARDEAGFYGGKVAVPGALLSAKELSVILAGDPYEQGAGTAAWPVRPAEGKVEARRVRLLIDGMPAAEAREKDRAAGARRAGIFVVAAAGFVEVCLFLLLGRSSRRGLVEHLAEVAEGAEERAGFLRSARERPVLGLLMAVSLVALAFALVVAFGALR